MLYMFEKGKGGAIVVLHLKNIKENFQHQTRALSDFVTWLGGLVAGA